MNDARTKPPWLLIALQCISWVLLALLAFATPREETVAIWTLMGLLFALYGFTLHKARSEDTRLLLGCAVVAHVVVWGATPALSDDIYRYLWDGRLWAAGSNPFAMLPATWVQTDAFGTVPGLDPAHFQALAFSQDYFASYPPLCHLLFWLSALFAPSSLTAHMLILKAFMLALSLGVLAALPKALKCYDQPPERALIYALNPLIPMELVANAHLEAPMVLLMVLFLIAAHREHWGKASLALAGAVSIKLIPLIATPYLIRRLSWRRLLGVATIILAVNALGYALILHNTTQVFHYLEGLGYFVRKFHFNGSFSYLLAGIFHVQTGEPSIPVVGRVLSLVVFGVIVVHALRFSKARRDTLPDDLLTAWVVFLLGALVVHPWYLATPLMLSVFTRRRAIVVWTIAVQVTWLTYAQLPHSEPFALIALEYIALFIALGWDKYMRSEATT